MKALITVVAAASVLVPARSAWACGQCFGDGSSSSVLGWVVLGGVGLLVYRLMRKP